MYFAFLLGKAERWESPCPTSYCILYVTDLKGVVAKKPMKRAESSNHTLIPSHLKADIRSSRHTSYIKAYYIRAFYNVL